VIERPEKFGGKLSFATYNDLEQTYTAGLHPLDLKNATASYINRILEPIRKYFEKHPGNYTALKQAGILQ
jgi:tyrosyl-tRNA synthetase